MDILGVDISKKVFDVFLLQAARQLHRQFPNDATGFAKLRQWLRERGKQPMVIVAAAMRKLLHLVYGVLKNGIPFDPAYGTP